MYARLGSKVTVVEFLDNIVPTMVRACTAARARRWGVHDGPRCVKYQAQGPLHHKMKTPVAV